MILLLSTSLVPTKVTQPSGNKQLLQLEPMRVLVGGKPMGVYED